MSTEGTYYLAGPMRGYPEHNFPAFREAAKNLRYNGWNIVCPTEINPGADKIAADNPGEYQFGFLRRDLIKILQCTGIILLPGWPKSRGARTELNLALDLELDVRFYYQDDKTTLVIGMQ